MSKMARYGYWSLVTFLTPLISFANDAGGASGSATWIAPAVGLGLGIAVAAAATAQGRIAGAFMEGASRNPGSVNVMRTPLLLSLIFVETLVLFTVLIMFMLYGKM